MSTGLCGVLQVPTHRFGVAQGVDVEVPRQAARLKLGGLQLWPDAAWLRLPEGAVMLQNILQAKGALGSGLTASLKTWSDWQAGSAAGVSAIDGGRSLHGEAGVTASVLTVYEPATPGSSASGAASMVLMPTELFTSRSRICGVSANHMPLLSTEAID